MVALQTQGMSATLLIKDCFTPSELRLLASAPGVINNQTSAVSYEEFLRLNSILEQIKLEETLELEDEIMPNLHGWSSRGGEIASGKAPEIRARYPHRICLQEG